MADKNAGLHQCPVCAAELWHESLEAHVAEHEPEPKEESVVEKAVTAVKKAVAPKKEPKKARSK